MVYKIIAVFFVIFSVSLLFFSAKALFDKKWIMGFLRGCAGFILLAISVLLALIARDIATYTSIVGDQSVLTLSFSKKEGNHYSIEIQESSGTPYMADIVGQQWQLNARMLKWSPIMSAIGFKTGYKLESIQGRFIELQMDRLAGGQPPFVFAEPAVIDTWATLQMHPWILSSVQAYTSTPGFVPAADGAIYDVVLSGTHLSVLPLNDAAKSALASW